MDLCDKQPMDFLCIKRRAVGRKTHSDALIAWLICVGISAILSACSNVQRGHPEKQALLQVAFMPDIHFHDIYGKFADGAFAGIENPSNGKRAIIRSMSAQLNSTRLFNENYFALLAALDDVVARGVKYVALPGDFSDNGQPVNIRGLKEILSRYSSEHGLEFFAVPGNHDPVRPFTLPAGIPDLLGESGKQQPIFSRDAEQGVADLGAGRLPVIYSNELVHLGYSEILSELREMGFYPKRGYLYWETPFSTYKESSYSFERALSASGLSNREYRICAEGVSSGDSLCQLVPDSSYLVEPMDGLWLLAIDANVYVPERRGSNGEVIFAKSSQAGYNKVISHKAFLLDWIEDVAVRADREGKTLLAFSHFPMVEFYDNQSDLISETFNINAMQLQRRPAEEVSRALAKTGLRVHVAGHMHINDTGVRRYKNGDFLVNIQAPSLAAYLPAYKLLTILSNRKIKTETIVLNDVPRFDELFDLYRIEHQQLERAKGKLWDREILKSNSYREFSDAHLRQLIKRRFLTSDWPESLWQQLLGLNGLELLTLTFLELPNQAFIDRNPAQIRLYVGWQEATQQAIALCKQERIPLASLTGWSGWDVVVDFYRLKNADALAISEIRSVKLGQYNLLATRFKTYLSIVNKDGFPSNNYFNFVIRVSNIFSILSGFTSAEPSVNFLLDLDTGDLKAL